MGQRKQMETLRKLGRRVVARTTEKGVWKLLYSVIRVLIDSKERDASVLLGVWGHRTILF